MSIQPSLRFATLFLALLFLCLAHKPVEPNPSSQETHSIYVPFSDVPSAEDEVIVKDGNSDEEKKQEAEEFNEMLKYGLIAGSILLSFMLVKTCTINRVQPRREPRVPMLDRRVQPASSARLALTEASIDQQIKAHEAEINRLMLVKRQLEVERQEQEAATRRQEQILRQQREQEMVSLAAREQFCPHPQYNYYGNIPVGRPLQVSDNNSSFASDYPTL